MTLSLFQLIALPLIAVMALLAVRNLVRQRARFLVSLLWLLLWLGAGTAIAVPDATTAVAHVLGIQRGADLVFYCSVLASFVGFFLIYLRLRDINRQLTLVVRDLAIRNAQSPGPRPNAD